MKIKNRKRIFLKASISLMAVFILFIFFKKEPNILPDYDKNLDEVAISMDNIFINNELLNRTNLEKLVSVLPKRTKIYLFSSLDTKQLPKYLRDRVKNSIKAETNFWIQDSFEVINNNKIIVPGIRFRVFNSGIEINDFYYLDRQVIQTPFYFEGGNLFIVKTPRGDNAAILGYGSVTKTAEQLGFYKNNSILEAEKKARKIIELFFWDKFKIKTYFLGEKIESR